ncbi:7-carboxy-7-deazaguanine synthase QueE [Nocardia sp. NPDC088792]|uniref:7-carboxy-7-deazaguanine synthase QueE n=1 Tax=Nocardia sp. NPDC088792 TaxID=3364332 RepID=UPI00380A944E
MTAAATDRRPGIRHHPVIELFGPTIQGEGPDAGMPCLFVRFGGCDYRCTWCDSMHAVDPATVRREARRLDEADIVAELRQQVSDPTGMLVVLSGGNPAMHELGFLVHQLHDAGMRVSVETQGSLWKEWLRDVDRLVISPKPPSSGMATPAAVSQSARFMSAATQTDFEKRDIYLKVVCFDSADVEFAFHFREHHRRADGTLLPLFLSSGTDIGSSLPLPGVASRFRWLCELVAGDPRAKDCKVLPQLHVIAWGNEKGR